MRMVTCPVRDAARRRSRPRGNGGPKSNLMFLANSSVHSCQNARGSERCGEMSLLDLILSPYQARTIKVTPDLEETKNCPQNHEKKACLTSRTPGAQAALSWKSRRRR